MKDRLLTLDDLCEFYSTKKRKVHFSCSGADDDPIVVQTGGVMTFEETDENMPDGLLAVSFQHALHTGENLNHSYISKEVLEEKLLPTFVNRPILGYIHYIDDVPYFKGHEMHIDPDTDEIIYDEVPVGIVPETNNAKMVYDKENDRYNVVIDGYIFEEYSKAAEIIQREGECFVSVEIAIKEMNYSPKEGILEIEDGYFSGITILGKDENGNKVLPGMAGSKVTLKDFRRRNNSMFNEYESNEESDLINTLERLNATLARLYKENYRKEESTAMKDIQEEVKEELEEETVAGENETTVGTEEESQRTPEVAEAVNPDDEDEDENENPDEENQPENEEGSDEETPEEDGSDETDEDNGGEGAEETPEEVPEEEPEEETDESADDGTDEDDDEENRRRVYTRTFELSFGEIECSLYQLLEPVEEANNDYYYIVSVYDEYFIYQGQSGFYKQEYSKDDDVVAFVGDAIEVYPEFLTVDEQAELEDMRSNYPEVEEELNTYKAKELHAEREAILADEAYSEYLDTDAFKEIKENLDTYSLDDLRTNCELAYAKSVRGSNKANFAADEPKKEKAPFFNFAKAEHDTSFLDGLLKQAKH